MRIHNNDNMKQIYLVIKWVVGIVIFLVLAISIALFPEIGRYYFGSPNIATELKIGDSLSKLTSYYTKDDAFIVYNDGLCCKYKIKFFNSDGTYYYIWAKENIIIKIERY